MRLSWNEVRVRAASLEKGGQTTFSSGSPGRKGMDFKSVPGQARLKGMDLKSVPKRL